MRFLFYSQSYSNDLFIDFCNLILQLHQKYFVNRIGNDTLLYQRDNELKNYFFSCLSDSNLSQRFNKKYDSNEKRIIKGIIANSYSPDKRDINNLKANIDTQILSMAIIYDYFLLYEGEEYVRFKYDGKDYLVYCFNLDNINERINNFFLYKKNSKHNKAKGNISPNLFADDVNQKLLYASFSDCCSKSDLSKLNSKRRWFYFESIYVDFRETSNSLPEIVYHSFNPLKSNVDERVIRFFEK